MAQENFFCEGGKAAMEDEALIDYKSEGVEGRIKCENGCSDESFS